MKRPPDAMKVSGTHLPLLLLQSASFDAIAAGTSAVSRQCAPPTLPASPSHSGSVFGSRTGGPTCGQGSDPASSLPVPPSSLQLEPSSLPSSQTPVLCCVSGLMHGAHFSFAAHVAWGSRPLFLSTSGTQSEMHA